VPTTFGLVHGAWHGAWCWEPLQAELEQRGQRSVAVDLPCDDWDAGLARNAEIVSDALGDADDVVLVGHSLGGITIPVVADRRPVRRMVFLCAMLPQPGKTMDEVLGSADQVLRPEFAPFDEVIHDDGSVSWRKETAAEAFFHDCPPDVAAWAASKLRRQVWATTQEPCPLSSWPDVPSTYVICTEDRAINPDWSRRAAKEIGADVVELPGSHSPFLSRPVDLADLLVSLA
jgi:pimeloyl-ACP methyl ester carboxylesterase